MEKIIIFMFIVLPSIAFTSPMMQYFNLKKNGRLTDLSHNRELLLLLIGFIVLLLIIYIIGRNKE